MLSARSSGISGARVKNIEYKLNSYLDYKAR